MFKYYDRSEKDEFRGGSFSGYPLWNTLEHVYYIGTLINACRSKNCCLNAAVVPDNAMKSGNLIKHQRNFSSDGSVSIVPGYVFTLSLFVVVSTPTPRWKCHRPQHPLLTRASLFRSCVLVLASLISLRPLFPLVLSQ